MTEDATELKSSLAKTRHVFFIYFPKSCFCALQGINQTGDVFDKKTQKFT